MKRILVLLLCLTISLAAAGCVPEGAGGTTTTNTTQPDHLPAPEKPVIYLYPETETEVTVELAFNGRLTFTYPEYNGAWHVLARPDGMLTDMDTGREYAYLFWEGISNVPYDMDEGFVVAGEDTAQFLYTALAQLGLTPREANEFMVYWLPRMQGNPYNLITFQQEAYTDNAVLKITPEPDSVLRVFMVWQPLEEKIEITQPKLESFDRIGFTVVEWGGAELPG